MTIIFDSTYFKDIKWLKPLLNSYNGSKESAMLLAIAIANYSANNGGGPFGAIITDKTGKLIECGCNEVINKIDSTAHAEIIAIRRAQQALKLYDLKQYSSPLTLYTSCAPCIQCFGAIYWSGITNVITAATKEDAEKAGFDEGLIPNELWDVAKNKKNITYELEFKRNEAKESFKIYKENSGRIY